MNRQRYQQIKRVTLVGAVANIALAAGKIGFGWLGQSQALIADGLHSLSDLLTDGLVIIAARFGSQDADADHPYGHERIETIATMFLAMLLLLVALFIIYDAVMHLMKGHIVTPQSYVLWVALISIFVKEGLYQYTDRVAKRLQSELLRANAWHHRSDAASSLVVLFGIMAALMGFPYLDDLAAVVVGLMIAKMGWDLGWPSAQELVDTAVDVETQQQIEVTIARVPGVLAMHQLRTRSMAGNILVDVHVLINGKRSVSEGHHIAHQVQAALKNEYQRVVDVTVHIDSEDDECAAPSQALPSREAILPQIKSQVQHLPGAEGIQGVVLHYLSGKLQIEICLPLAMLNTSESAASIAHQYRTALRQLPEVASVDVAFVNCDAEPGRA